MSGSPFSADEEDRIRQIAVDVAVAASQATAQLAANRELDRLRLTPAWIGEFLGGEDGNP